jgi:hypothetical protein
MSATVPTSDLLAGQSSTASSVDETTISVVVAVVGGCLFLALVAGAIVVLKRRSSRRKEGVVMTPVAQTTELRSLSRQQAEYGQFPSPHPQDVVPRTQEYGAPPATQSTNYEAADSVLSS